MFLLLVLTSIVFVVLQITMALKAKISITVLLSIIYTVLTILYFQTYMIIVAVWFMGFICLGFV